MIDRAKAEECLAFAHRLADAAAPVTLKHFRTQVAVENKHASLFDPVTIADKGAEEAIRTLIESNYPDHGILGEELGRVRGASALTWVIDPIDGTRSYISGSPLWGTLIALGDADGPFLGILDQPFLGERFCGLTVKGASSAEMTWARETRRLKTRPCAKLSEAVISTTTPEMFQGADEAAFARLAGAARLKRFGGDCYQYAMLASGFLDLVVEAGLAPYDIQALMPIIRAAGGVVTTWTGEDAAHGGKIIAAGDARMHAEAVTMLSRVSG